MQKAHIKGSTVLDGNTAAVTVAITHAPNALDKNIMLGAITAACGSKMMALAGSFNKLSQSPTQTLVHGAVAATKDILDYNPDTCQFKSISSNMFMDEDSAVWNLRHTDGKKVLIKTNFVDDVEEISTLLQSCSATQKINAAGADKETAELVKGVRYAQSTIDAGAFVSVAANGKVIQGAVVATVYDKADSRGKLKVLPIDGTPAILVSRSSVMHNETIACKDLEGGFQSCSGSTSMDRLLQYYGKLYETQPEYFAKLAERIRNYSFA